MTGPVRIVTSRLWSPPVDDEACVTAMMSTAFTKLKAQLGDLAMSVS